MIWKRESYEDNIIPPPLRRYIKCRLVLNYKIEVINTLQVDLGGGLLINLDTRAMIDLIRISLRLN